MCMMCVALNGYHNSDCKYIWSTTNDGIVIKDEVYPILYTDKEGKYTCKVHINGKEDISTFHVTSKLSNRW